LRHITFNGVSTGDLGITVAEADIGQAVPRIITESVPYKDGAYDFSRIDGGLHYDNRTLTYKFNIIAKTAELASTKLADVLSWVYSYDESNNTLSDEHFGNYAFTGVSVCDTPTVEYKGGARRAMVLTVKFTADPYMQLLNPVEAIKSSDLNGSTDEILVIVNANVGTNGDTPKLFAVTTDAGSYDLSDEPDFTLTSETNGGITPYWTHSRTLDTVFAFPVMSKYDFPKLGAPCGRYGNYVYIYQNGAATGGTVSYYNSGGEYTEEFFNTNLVKYSTISKTLDTPTDYYKGMTVHFTGGTGTVTTINADKNTTTVRIKCDSGVSWTAYATDNGGKRL